MKTIYIVGICGTAMGNIAMMLKKKGFNVTGSDSNIYPPMSTVLEKAGITILKGYSEENIKKLPDIAIIGNVVRRDNPEAQYLINKGVTYYSMPQALRMFFFNNKQTIVVTGTHGKTTTSFMAAWMLEKAGLNPGFFVGGVPKDFDVMGRDTDSDYFVIEGDEYDTAFFDKEAKFFHYNPKYLIINCIEFDHADIFADLQSIKNSFAKLVAMIPKDGVIIYNAQDKNVLDIISNAKCKTISFSESGTKADFSLSNVKVRHGEQKLEFDVNNKNKTYQFKLNMPGAHNALNATAVIALSQEMGIDVEKVKKAFDTFKGVKRRQEVYGVAGGRIIIDDFAHHPTAMACSIDAVKDWYSPRKVWCLFEPRSATSRTNILQKEVIEALGHSKNVLIAPVDKPERVEKEKRFDPEFVCRTLREKGINAKAPSSIDEMVKELASNTSSGDVILVMSNGGFGGIYEKLMTALKS